MMARTPKLKIKISGLLGKINALNAAIDEPDSDLDVRGEFADIFHLHDYNLGNRKVGTVPCGSFEIEDTPKSLYRLLFLARPESVKFSTMYKSESLFALTSPDGEFVADIQFYKYELGVYLSAEPKHVDQSKRSGIIGGMPGCDNGEKIQTPELKAWADLLKKCLSSKWLVYGGNDFEV